MPRMQPRGTRDRNRSVAPLRRVFSQFGEDGVIERLFEILEPTSQFCVGFGAH